MNRRVGYILCLAASMCLLCSCKTEVNNEFVEHIRSSIDSQKESGEDIEVIGKITRIDDMTITVSLMQVDGDMSFERGAGDIGGGQKPDEKLSPEGTSTYYMDSSSQKEPIKPLSEPKATKKPENIRPQEILKETGAEVEVTIDEDTKLVKEDKTITVEDLKEGHIVYIVINDGQVTKIRVSGRKIMKDESPKPGVTNPSEQES